MYFRKNRGGQRAFLYLLLSCLQLKIILMYQWHVLGWHMLLPFKCYY